MCIIDCWFVYLCLFWTQEISEYIFNQGEFIIFVDFQSCSFSGFNYLPPVSWTASAWIDEDRGPLQQTPDFHPSLQGVIAQPAWNGTGPIIVALRNISSGVRDVYSFDGDPLKAPSLFINYNESKYWLHLFTLKRYQGCAARGHEGVSSRKLAIPPGI